MKDTRSTFNTEQDVCDNYALLLREAPASSFQCIPPYDVDWVALCIKANLGFYAHSHFSHLIYFYSTCLEHQSVHERQRMN